MAGAVRSPTGMRREQTSASTKFTSGRSLRQRSRDQVVVHLWSKIHSAAQQLDSLRQFAFQSRLLGRGAGRPSPTLPPPRELHTITPPAPERPAAATRRAMPPPAIALERAPRAPPAPAGRLTQADLCRAAQ